MKKFKWIKDMLPYMLVQAAPVIAFVVVMLMAYSISVSDLPDWFKFFLLK